MFLSHIVSNKSLKAIHMAFHHVHYLHHHQCEKRRMHTRQEGVYIMFLERWEDINMADAATLGQCIIRAVQLWNMQHSQTTLCWLFYAFVTRV